MLGGGFSLGMYRKAMSMHIAAGDGCNYCRCDEGKAPMERKEGCTLLRGERWGVRTLVCVKAWFPDGMRHASVGILCFRGF